MSPEQAAGRKDLTPAADVYSLGAILYELLTGRRAFDGASHADRMAAILNAEPAPLEPAIEDALPGVGRVIAHCLEKAPQARFQSASDLAFALELLGTRVPQAAVKGESRTQSRHKFRRLTYREGAILSARFAADGKAICYGAAWEGRPVELFWAYPGSPESRPLGFPRTDLLDISSTGEMAVSLRRHAEGGFIYSGMLARMPVGGGGARELLDAVIEADWSPDGRSLCIVRQESGRTLIEYPMGTPIYQTTGWVSHARVSPKGDRVAFLDHPTRGDDMGSAAVVDLAGNVLHLSDGWSSARGLAWAPTGDEIVFTAFQEGVGRSIYAVTLEGVQRPILEVPGHLTLVDISPQGTGLVILENERTRVQFHGPNDAAPRDLTWLDWTLVRALSADGSWMLFDETGVGGGELHSVYLRATDGSPAVRLGDGSCLDLSPDGRWALAAVSPTRLDILPCGAGSPRTIPLSGIEIHNAAWFPDGESICVLGLEGGGDARLFKVDAITGKAEAFSQDGISSYEVIVSPDGKSVASRGPDRRLMIYPVDGGPAAPIDGVLPTERAVKWSQDGKSIIAFSRGELPSKGTRIDIATGERHPWRELSPADATGVEGITIVALTRSEDAFAYSYSQRLNDLYVVEGLR
jgi:Tol biopolymer transport system component